MLLFSRRRDPVLEELVKVVLELRQQLATKPDNPAPSGGCHAAAGADSASFPSLYCESW